MKKIALGTIAAFVLIFVFDWVFHGMMLKPIYDKTPELWRPESDMQKYFGFMMLGQLLFAFFLCLNFWNSDKYQGVSGGVKFGLLIGGLFVAMNFGMYAWLPLPDLTLPILWSIGGLIQMTLIGILLSFVCGRCKKEA